MVSLPPSVSSLYDAVGVRPSSEKYGGGEEKPRGGLERLSEGDRADLSSFASSLAQSGGAVALFEFNYQSVRAFSETRGGGSVTRSAFLYESFEMHLTVAGDPEAAQSLFEKLKAEFTPEKVAERIAHVGLSGFLEGEEEADEAGKPSRSDIRDLILQAVQRGHGEALRLLGPLSEEHRSPLEETLRLVRERLDAFALEGEKAPEPEGQVLP